MEQKNAIEDNNSFKNPEIIIVKELTKIDEMLEGIENANATRAKKLTEQLREVFYQNPTKNQSDLLNCILDLSGWISIYRERREDTNPFGMGSQVDESFEKIEKKVQDLSPTRKEENDFEVLEESQYPKMESMLEMVQSKTLSSAEDFSMVREKIDELQMEITEKSLWQFAPKLAEAKYHLVKGYLECHLDNEATEYLKALVETPSYTKITGKHHDEVETVEVTSMKRQDEALRLLLMRKIKELCNDGEKCCQMDAEVLDRLFDYREIDNLQNIQLDDLNLWKTIVSAETGKKLEIVQEDPKKEDKKPKEKRKKREPKADDKDYKLIIIKYNPEVPGGIDRKQMKKFASLYIWKRQLIPKKPIKVVIEEGITELPPVPYTKTVPFYEWEGASTKYETREVVEVPKEFQDVYSWKYFDCRDIDQVQLLRYVKKIELPDSIEKIPPDSYNAKQFQISVTLAQKAMKSSTGLKEVLKDVIMKDYPEMFEKEKSEEVVASQTHHLDKQDYKLEEPKTSSAIQPSLKSSTDQSDDFGEM